MTEKQLLDDFIEEVYNEFGVVYHKKDPTVFDYPHTTKPWKERIPKYLLKEFAKQYLEGSRK